MAGRPDAPAECVCFGRDWWSGRVGVKGWLRGISLSLFVIVCCTTRESRESRLRLVLGRLGGRRTLAPPAPLASRRKVYGHESFATKQTQPALCYCDSKPLLCSHIAHLQQRLSNHSIGPSTAHLPPPAQLRIPEATYLTQKFSLPPTNPSI
jgi:hypothetical protein